MTNEPATHEQCESISGAGVLPGRIALVDGSPQHRQQLHSLLAAKLKYKVTMVTDAAEAMALLGTGADAVDLLLLNLFSVQSGLGYIQQFRKASSAPVVVLHMPGDYQGVTNALMLGAHDFLTVPVSEERLGVTLRNAIEYSQVRRRAEFAREPESPKLQAEEAMISLINPDGNARKIEEIEQAMIQFAIRHYNGRMSEVARRLGIGRSTLYRKLGSFEGA